MTRLKRKPQTIETQRNLGTDPCRRNERNRVLDLVKQGLPWGLVAQKSNVPEAEVRAIVAGEVELASRIRARIRVVLPHQLMMAAEMVIGECEGECYTEREVA